MRKILTNPFIDVYPKIDVHGEIRDTVIPLVDIFIKDNIKLRNKKIVVIHGNGQGILRNTIHDYLKHDKRIKKYYLDMYNIGTTIIELK